MTRMSSEIMLVRFINQDCAPEHTTVAAASQAAAGRLGQVVVRNTACDDELELARLGTQSVAQWRWRRHVLPLYRLVRRRLRSVLLGVSSGGVEARVQIGARLLGDNGGGLSSLGLWQWPSRALLTLDRYTRGCGALPTEARGTR